MDPSTMTPTDALALLDKVVSEVNTTRLGHIKIQEAVRVLHLLVEASKVVAKDA